MHTLVMALSAIGVSAYNATSNVRGKKYNKVVDILL